jgi:plasmid maintenance system antidote protein VapI
MGKVVDVVSHLAKLTPKQVREIRAKYFGEARLSQTALAERYKVSQRTIHQIINGKIYKKVA